MIARLLLPLLAAIWPAGAQKAELRTYQDGRLGFSFRYPADYTFANVLESPGGFVSGVLKRGKLDVVIEARDLAGYPAEWRAHGRTNFADAAVAIAILRCDADGPDGSRSCPEVLRRSTFGNNHGLDCLEIELREVITRNEPKRTITRTRGPIYAVRIPGPDPPLILFFEFDPDSTTRADDTRILQEIVNSVRPNTER